MNLENENFQEETSESHEETREAYNSRNEISDLKSELAEIKNLINSTVSSKAGKQVAEEVEVSDDLALQLAQNPKHLAKFIQEQINNGISKFNTVTASKTWDEKAYDEYPNLKNDKSFQDAVKREIQDLLTFGDMTKSSPRLVYMATQLAASKMGVGKKAQQNTTKVSSGASALAASGSGAREPGSKKPAVMDNDPRLVLAKNLGWSQEKIDSYKKKLGDKDRSVSISKGRSISR